MDGLTVKSAGKVFPDSIFGIEAANEASKQKYGSTPVGDGLPSAKPTYPWKITISISIGKSTINRPFPIAMLN